jgi:hypothetical protein
VTRIAAFFAGARLSTCDCPPVTSLPYGRWAAARRTRFTSTPSTEPRSARHATPHSERRAVWQHHRAVHGGWAHRETCACVGCWSRQRHGALDVLWMCLAERDSRRRTSASRRARRAGDRSAGRHGEPRYLQHNTKAACPQGVQRCASPSAAELRRSEVLRSATRAQGIASQSVASANQRPPRNNRVRAKRFGWLRHCVSLSRFAGEGIDAANRPPPSWPVPVSSSRGSPRSHAGRCSFLPPEC